MCVTEPHAGSDVAGLKTRAVRTIDGWTINGSKTFITNGIFGDIYIVAARTDPEAKGSRGISLFIVEKGNPGLKIDLGFGEAEDGGVCRHGASPCRPVPRTGSADASTVSR